MSKRSLADIIDDWEKLLTNVRTRVAELPELQTFTAPLVPELEAALAEVRAMGARLAAQVALKQQESKERREVVDKGAKVAARLRAALKAHFGLDSELLLEFGTKPIRPRTRSAPREVKSPKPGGNPAPASSENPDSQKS